MNEQDAERTVQNTVATMRLSGFVLTEEEIEILRRIAIGELDSETVIKDIKKKHLTNKER